MGLVFARGGITMGPEQNLRWLFTRLKYYRKCQTQFASGSRESQYIMEKIREFEGMMFDIIRDYFQVA